MPRMTASLIFGLSFLFFLFRSLQRQREIADKRNQQLADFEAKVPHKVASPAR